MGEKNFLEIYGQITNVIKSAAELAQKSDNIPLLQSLYDARGELLVLQEEMQSLKTENNDLKVKLSIQDNIVRKGNVLCLQTSTKPDLGPYCPACYGDKHKLISLIDRHNGYYFCNICNMTISR